MKIAMKILGRLRLAAAAVVLGAVVGCSNPPAPGTVVTPIDQQEVSGNAELKSRLESIAETGMTGSGLAGLREAIEKGGDAGLLADYQRLEAAATPEEAKTIAASMAGKL